MISLTTIPSPAEQDYWVQLLEVAYRYSLCSTETDNDVMHLLLTRTTKSMISKYRPKSIALDEQDSNGITTAYLSKIKSIRRLNNGFVPLLFAHACHNLKDANFETNFLRIVAGTLERAWLDLSQAQELSVYQWGVFTESIMEILSVLLARVYFDLFQRHDGRSCRRMIQDV